MQLLRLKDEIQFRLRAVGDGVLEGDCFVGHLVGGSLTGLEIDGSVAAELGLASANLFLELVLFLEELGFLDRSFIGSLQIYFLRDVFVFESGFWAYFFRGLHDTDVLLDDLFLEVLVIGVF